jgi:tRNA-dihydrouridine synthase B
MKFFLAPLADFTDAPFRLLCEKGGADKTYTEMVSAAALYHGHEKSEILLEKLPGESNVGCQIFGANEHEVAFAAKKIDALNRFCELNLNAGCPMAKVTRSGSGAKLAEDPLKVYTLLKAMKENTSLDVTLKTRLGPRPDRTMVFELVSAAESAGATSVILHARFTSQMHSGPVHYDVLSEAVSKSSIPIIGNGSIISRKSVEEFRHTGVSGVMIGRAAMSRPFIFSELKNIKTTLSEDSADNCIEHFSHIIEFQKHLARKYQFAPSLDAYSSIKMHTHLFRYFNGRPGSAALRARLNRVRSFREILDEISVFKEVENLRCFQ